MFFAALKKDSPLFGKLSLYSYNKPQKTKAMKKITKKELIEMFLNPEVSGLNGSSFIGIDTLTDVKLSGGKNNPMQGGVQKAVVGSSVMIFSNKKSNAYENMVERRLVAEGKDPKSFSLSPRAWGERIANTPLVLHKDEYYLEVIFLKAGETSYYYNSKPIKKDLIQGMPEKSEGGKQGGLDNKVIIRTYKISSIARITINKEVYIICD